MNDGEVTEVGTFKELMGHAGSFAEYVRNYLCQKLEDDETILTGLLSTLIPPLPPYL